MNYYNLPRLCSHICSYVRNLWTWDLTDWKPLLKFEVCDTLTVRCQQIWNNKIFHISITVWNIEKKNTSYEFKWMTLIFLFVQSIRSTSKNSPGWAGNLIVSYCPKVAKWPFSQIYSCFPNVWKLTMSCGCGIWIGWPMFFLVGLGSSTLQLQNHDPTVIPNTNPDGRDGRVVYPAADAD